MKKIIDHNFDVTFIPGDITRDFGRDRVKTKIPNPYRLRVSTPIMALDHFHRIMQREFKVCHRDYAVKNLEKVYRHGAANNGPEIRMAFDLPDTTTPDLTKNKRTKVETVLMPFWVETQGAIEMTEGAFVDAQ